MRARYVAFGGFLVGLLLLVGCQFPWTDLGTGEEPPELVPLGLQFAYSAAGEEPGFVGAHLDSPPGEVTVYTRAADRLSSFCFHPGAPKLYFVSGNDNTIWRADYINGTWYEEVPVYQHDTYIYQHNTYLRCVRFVHDEAGQHPEDPADEWHLFFSEATGAGGDGVIYRLVGGSVEAYYTVDLDDVGGFWSGWFGFSPDGTLYLSSGNTTAAKLYRVDGDAVEEVFDPGGTMAGFVFLTQDTLLYADWDGHIYFLDLAAGEAESVYENPDLKWLSDVDLLPGWWLSG